MLSVIEVKCPHCGARGQIVMPPLGAIIVGPCPQCHEFVAVFCGRALPLNKDIVLNGSSEEKQEHIMGALADFLEEQVAELVDRSMQGLSYPDDIEPSEVGPVGRAMAGDEPDMAELVAGDAPISEAEVDHFRRFELPSLDNRQYFKTIFE